MRPLGQEERAVAQLKVNGMLRIRSADLHLLPYIVVLLKLSPCQIVSISRCSLTAARDGDDGFAGL